MSSRHAALDLLATKKLEDRGPLSREFLELKCHSWEEVWHYVNQLAYARTSDSNRFHLVLEERRGTCSTKHALLAALAEEQEVALFLMMGLMEMNAKKFPALQSVLEKYYLSSIVETHCYLIYEGERLDITFPGKRDYPQASDFLKEWIITPCEIGDVKIKRHQEEMKNWIAEKKIPYTFEKVWSIREESIDALSRGTTPE